MVPTIVLPLLVWSRIDRPFSYIRPQALTSLGLRVFGLSAGLDRPDRELLFLQLTGPWALPVCPGGPGLSPLVEKALGVLERKIGEILEALAPLDHGARGVFGFVPLPGSNALYNGRTISTTRTFRPAGPVGGTLPVREFLRAFRRHDHDPPGDLGGGKP